MGAPLALPLGPMLIDDAMEGAGTAMEVAAGALLTTGSAELEPPSVTVAARLTAGGALILVPGKLELAWAVVDCEILAVAGAVVDAPEVELPIVSPTGPAEQDRAANANSRGKPDAGCLMVPRQVLSRPVNSPVKPSPNLVASTPNMLRKVVYSLLWGSFVYFTKRPVSSCPPAFPASTIGTFLRL
jgi:hypothetical protein